MKVDVKGRKRNRTYRFDGITACAMLNRVTPQYLRMVLKGERHNPALKLRYVHRSKEMMKIVKARVARDLIAAKRGWPKPKQRRTFEERLAAIEKRRSEVEALRNL